MIKYLLLRDNKESGPYDLEELRTKGLKAYDLVWIEGKSAAWRYPSEVDELKSFAPAVEEQPFDRFFKRPSQNAQAAPALSRTETENEYPVLNNSADSPTLGEPSAVPGKRIIYVTLPSPANKESISRIPASKGLIAVQQVDRNQSLQQPSFQPQPPSQAAAQSPLQTPGQPLSPSQVIAQSQPQGLAQSQPQQPMPPSFLQPPVPAQSQPGNKTQPVPPKPSAPQPTAAPVSRANRHFKMVNEQLLYSNQGPEENFSHDGGDMWKTTVEMPPRLARTGLKKVVQPVIVLLCILALLVAGIFIGLSMNRNSFGFSPKLASKDPSVPLTPIQRADHPSSAMPVYTASVPVNPNPRIKNENADNSSASRQLNSVAAPVAKTANRDPSAPATVPKKRNSTSKDKSSLAIQKPISAAPDKDSAATSFPAMHREAIHRTDATTVDKDAVKSNIASLVSAGSGKYNVGPFGGISEVQITVSNRSIYSLDLVVVEVRYIQANKKIFKTENLYFRGIGAGAALMQEAPKSSRGIKIEYKITFINSKELGLSYSGI